MGSLTLYMASRQAGQDKASSVEREPTMKFAICQELFEGWEWERQCQAIASNGYTGIELAPFTLASRIGEVSPRRRRELKSVAEAHGLEICGLHWLLAKTEGLHLTTSHAVVRRATSNYIIELANACADLGGTIMVFGSPMQRISPSLMSWSPPT